MQIQNMMSYFRKGRAKKDCSPQLALSDFVSAIMQDFSNLACRFFIPEIDFCIIYMQFFTIACVVF